jgi:hypothetical protein
MDVAGLGIDRIQDEAIDQNADLNTGFSGIGLQVFDRMVHKSLILLGVITANASHWPAGI